MPDAAPALAGRPRCRRAPAELRAGARSAEPGGHALLCALLSSETEANVCAAAIDVLAEVGGPEALPVLAACAERFRDNAVSRLRDQDRDRPDHLAASVFPCLSSRALTEEEFRRLCEFLYRRTGMVFTEAKRYYVERRVVERMTATGSGSFASYFARLRSDVAGRDRAVRQRLHRQRNLFLSRRPPAPLPDHRPADGATAAQEEGRLHPHLVGALLHRRRAVLDRHVAAGKLAAGR